MTEKTLQERLRHLEAATTDDWKLIVDVSSRLDALQADISALEAENARLNIQETDYFLQIDRAEAAEAQLAELREHTCCLDEELAEAREALNTLFDAWLWIDTHEPGLVAQAEQKFNIYQRNFSPTKASTCKEGTGE